ncbi:MAG: hypothetical protein WAN43_19660 [Rhodomicrobium sp.]|jgi:hypothetical protein
MPEISQYQFSTKELLEMLIRKSGVREGKWILMANFAVTPGNFGQSLDQVAPGAIFAISHIGIQKAPDDAPEGVWLDAAMINPPKKAKAST